ncbi:Proteasome subunit beta type [Cocos nucifera]|uniref:Proteasome subunit beta type n=1 Tax=Cocos nucifera TaxID=13894 RepID=A0A8K0HW02_COCNU|nr:Proteasome subunit beta type [Cocos nucifera]
MKLDTSGLESFAPLSAPIDDLCPDLSAPPTFDLPRSADFDGFQKDAIQMVKPAKGTTTLAFIFKEGVMVAADSRASMGGYILGPGLYYVDSEGGRLKGTRFSVGSGSPYAYGVLDNGYRYDMSIEEAAELARRAIYHATFRDAASGGVASVYYVGPSGWKKLSGDDVGELHFRYYPVAPSPTEQEMSELSPA